MTKARDIIEAYASDVAARLPLAQRADIARELLALLHDEMQARAEAESRAPDEATARAVIAAFGAPAEVAAGYRPAGLTIIPPETASNFLTTSIAGVVLFWGIGLMAAYAKISDGIPVHAAAIGWFFNWGLGAFWWPGVIVMCSAAAAWFRTRARSRSTPAKTVVKPKGDKSMTSDVLKRIGAAILLLVALFFAIFFVDPDYFLKQIVPWMNVSWLTYTDDFQAGRLWAMITYMCANVILLGFYVFAWFESREARIYGIGVSAGGFAVLLGCALGGPAIVVPASDELFRFILLVLAFVELYSLWQRVSRESVLAR